MTTSTRTLVIPRPRAVRGPFARLVRRPLAIVSAAVLLVIVGACLLAPLLPLADPNRNDLLAALQGPGAEHLLGTDQLGRDLLSRILHGGIPSLGYAGIALVVALGIGIPLGIMAGYLGGWWDRVIAAIADIGLAIPVLIMTLVILTVFDGMFWLAMALLGVLMCPPVIRNVRGAVIGVSRENFVDAARVAGLSPLRIMLSHILPRIVGPLLVQTTLIAALAISFTVGLAFLGFGPQPPDATWGGMIQDAVLVLSRTQWPMIVAGSVVVVTVLALTILGDVIREATVDPWTSAARRLEKRGPANKERPRASEPVEAGDALVAVRDLQVTYAAGGNDVLVVKGISFDIGRGEAVGLVGESGCGKTTVARSIARILPGSGDTPGGGIRFRDQAVLDLEGRRLQAYRGGSVAYVFQDPMGTLEPSMRVGDLLAQVVRLHHRVTRAEARSRMLELLRRVQIKDAETIARRYPHELSGGLAQRVAIARAIAGEPELLIADEPTTALDASIRLGILDLLRTLQRETGMALLIVSHDWDVVDYLCDRAMVMYAGEIVEEGRLDDVLEHPAHPYTRALLDCRPKADSDRSQPLVSIVGQAAVTWPRSFDATRPAPASAEPLLRVENLVVEYGSGRRRHRAVDDVSFEIAEGETLGLLGESGSGKSTIGRAILGLVPVTSGRIFFRGTELTALSSGRRREFGSQVRAVFQDPNSTLNPVRRVGWTLLEGIARGGGEGRERMHSLLDRMGLPPGTAESFPAAFSGGQRQRISIGRAMMSRPSLVVCDEPVTALDVSVQAQVLNLLREVQQYTGVSYLFVGHDIEVVRYMSDRIAVLEHGRLVETGPADDVVHDPSQPYTKRLVAAMLATSRDRVA